VASGLADLVAPVKVGHFLARVYGRTSCYVEGPPGRFAHLLPWPELNAILRRHRLAFPRLRLALDGATVPAEVYTQHERTRRGGTVPRLEAGAFTGQLRQGATMVLDAVDELCDPVGELAARLERDLGEHVQVNAYAGWGATHGFDVHWDDHDVFVLQVAGRKRWRIHGPSRPRPLFRDVEPAAEPPPEPATEHLLADGDVLYVPRGWWHVAAAIGEPSLHLTFGFNPATGIDLLVWLADRLRADERFRQDLPRFGAPQARRAHAAALRQALEDAWDPDVIDRFLADRDAQARPRPDFSLPSAASPGVLPAGDTARVRLLAPRAQLHRRDRTVELLAAGQRWTFASAAEPVLAALLDGEPRALGELCALHGDGARVRRLVAELVVRGLVAVADATAATAPADPAATEPGAADAPPGGLAGWS
jgi:ribosomal protein L16 Arg81 hydroxylase